MKRILFWIALSVTAISLSSCLTSEEHSTPVIRVSYLYRDTPLGVHDSINYGDTIHVGDTIHGAMILYGGYNNLTEFKVSMDTSALAFELVHDSTYAHLLAKDSKLKQGPLRFVSGCVMYPTGLRYVAKKTGDYQITFKLSSDAGEKYSPQEAWYIQPIR